MTAVNSWIPNMPRFEMENVAPVYSSGLRRFSRALPANSRISRAISATPFLWGVPDDRSDEAVLHGHRDPDVDAGVAPNTVSVPGRVHRPVLAQRGGNRPNYQIIQADLLTPLLEESVDARPRLDSADHVNVDREEKVRDRSERFAPAAGRSSSASAKP